VQKIERIQCGNGNCYLITENNNSVLVDTSRNKYKDMILEICKDKNVKLIVLTHGHVDHIQNASYLSEQLNVPIAMHKDDYELSKNNMLNPLYAKTFLGKILLHFSVSSFKKDKIESFSPDIFLKEEYFLENYGINAKIIELPGHTKGSIGIKAADTDLIAGDALMNLVYPTKSMLYEDEKAINESAEKISSMGDLTIHFGHGDPIKNKKRW